MRMWLQGDMRSQGLSGASACRLSPILAALSGRDGRCQTVGLYLHMLSQRDWFAGAFGGPLGDHWQSALSSAVVHPRPDLAAGTCVPKLFWSVNDD